MSYPSLVAQVVRNSLIVLLIVVTTVGLATGVLLYVQDVRELDSTLMAAAKAAGASDWGTEHAESTVHVRMLPPGDPHLPEGWEENAEEMEEPSWRTEGETRMLLLPVERGPEDNEEHAMLVATAPRVDIAHSVGPFAGLYTVVAGIAAACGALVQRRLLLNATAPLVVAQAAVSRVVGAGAGARVGEGGPAEVASLLHAVNGLLERLDRAFEAQARFTAEAAHELRTPITAMLGEIDVALRRPRENADYVRVLASAKEDVERLAELVEGLLLLARVDSGQAEHGRSDVDAATLVEEAARRERRTVERASGHLTVGDVPRVVMNGHPALLVAALSNLLRNAAIHAPGAEVKVDVQTDAGFVHFLVDDTGRGVPPAEREALFDRLARRGSARRDTAGLGLGLPLAREIARRHGGDCTLETAPGGGCRAVLKLPLAQ